METKHLTMAIRALRTFDHERAPDWADKAEGELSTLTADRDRLAARVAELEAALGKLLDDMRLQEFYGFSGELAEFPEIVSKHMNTAAVLLKKD